MENIKKLRCPICNAKVTGGKCPFCKITEEQILYASNTKAKKEVNKKKVYNSTLRPIDVKKSDMLTITLLYGLFGVGSFFVGKKNRGLYQAISFGVFFIFFVLELLFMMHHIENAVFNLFTDLVLLNFGICIIVWTLDVCRVILNRYAYPVVLPDVDKIEVAKEELRLIKEKLDHKNDKYKNVLIKIKNFFISLKLKLKTRKQEKLSRKQEKLSRKQEKLNLEKSKLDNELNKSNEDVELKDAQKDIKVHETEVKNEKDLGIEITGSDGVVTEKRVIKNNKKNRK